MSSDAEHYPTKTWHGLSSSGLFIRHPLLIAASLTLLSSVVGGLVAAALGRSGFAAAPFEFMSAMALYGLCFGYLFITHAESIRFFHRTAPRFQFYFAVLLVFVPVNLIQGVINSWPIIYVFADLIHTLMAILVYITARQICLSLPKTEERQTISKLATIVVGGLFLAVIPGIPISPGYVLTLLAVIFAILFAVTRGWFIWAVLSAMPLAAYLSRFPRGLILSIIVVFLLVAFARIFAKSILLVVCGALIVIGFVIYQFESFPFLPQRIAALGAIANLALQINWTEYSFQDLLNVASISTAIHQRIYEAEMVVAALNQNGPLAWMFGLGFGTVLDMSDAPDSAVKNAALLSAGQVHNVHLILFEWLARYGLVGIALFAWLGVRILSVYGKFRNGVIETGSLSLGFMLSLTLAGFYVYVQFASDWDSSYILFVMMGTLDAQFLRDEALRGSLRSVPDG